jgi:hypothetical protein
MVMKVSLTPFAAHNSHGQAKQFPRNLSIIWTRVLKKGSPSLLKDLFLLHYHFPIL